MYLCVVLVSFKRFGRILKSRLRRCSFIHLRQPFIIPFREEDSFALLTLTLWYRTARQVMWLQQSLPEESTGAFERGHLHHQSWPKTTCNNTLPARAHTTEPIEHRQDGNARRITAASINIV